MGGVEGGDYGAGGRWVALVAEKLAPWIYESALYSPNEMQHTRFWPRKEFPGKSHLHWDAFILLRSKSLRYLHAVLSSDFSHAKMSSENSEEKVNHHVCITLSLPRSWVSMSSKRKGRWSCQPKGCISVERQGVARITKTSSEMEEQ